VRLDRRSFLAGLTALACEKAASPPRIHRGFLGAFERLNRRVQSGLYSPSSHGRAYDQRDETPIAAFPGEGYFVSPTVPAAPAGWVLRVGGAADRPATFTLDDLTRMSPTEYRAEHHCVEGWSAIASWRGVRLADLAAIVGAHRVGFVEFRSFDVDASGRRYSSSWDRASAFHPQTILAYGMDGEPLTPLHGAPLRLYSPVKLGYKNVKYLTDVNFMPEATGGYWEDMGYEWFAGT
jgi:DMSO/TMAO reductase YedYZ molybdopterin-dependent catalytic subunit